MPRAFDWRLLLFLAAVFALKLVVLVQLQDHPLLQPEGGVDSAEYVALARRVMSGDLLLGPGLYYLSPLYVYFLAGLLALSDSLTFVRLVQIALGTGAVGFVFLTAREWFGTRAAWLAATLAALTGIFTFYEIVVFQSSIDVFLVAAGLWLFTRVLLRPIGHQSLSLPIFTGILFGLAFLNRPNIAIAIAGMVLAMLAGRRWRTAALVTAGLTIAVAPIAARNAIVTHTFAITSSQGGLNFYIGNHAGATGQYVAVPGVQANMAGQARDTRTVAEAAAGHALTDAQVSAYFSGRALGWIRDRPADAARLFGRKLALTASARHQWLDYSYPYYAHDTGSLLSALIVGPGLLVPLGVLGAALLLTGSTGSSGSTGSTGSSGSGFAGSGFAGSGFGGFWIWCSFVPLYGLSVAVFFVAERYRLPLFVPLCILSGAALAELPRAFREWTSDIGYRPSDIGYRSPAAAAGSAAVAAVAVVITWWPFQIDDGRVDEHLRLARVLMNRHDTVGAEAALERAHAMRPGDTATEFNLGMAQLGNGQVEEGLLHVRHAVDAGVAMPGARYALAGALLTTGDRNGAARLLESFHPAAEDDAESCRRVAQLATAAGVPQVAERYAHRASELGR